MGLDPEPRPPRLSARDGGQVTAPSSAAGKTLYCQKISLRPIGAYAPVGVQKSVVRNQKPPSTSSADLPASPESKGWRAGGGLSYSLSSGKGKKQQNNPQNPVNPAP